MFEKIIPVIIALIALQLLIKYINKRKKNNPSPSRNLDYKTKIDQYLKIGNFDEGLNNQKLFRDEIRTKLGNPDLMMDVPDSMNDVRRSFYLIIDGVTHAVKAKTGSKSGDDIKYNMPEKMFDEIVEVIKRHKI